MNIWFLDNLFENYTQWDRIKQSMPVINLKLRKPSLNANMNEYPWNVLHNSMPLVKVVIITNLEQKQKSA